MMYSSSTHLLWSLCVSVTLFCSCQVDRLFEDVLLFLEWDGLLPMIHLYTYLGVCECIFNWVNGQAHTISVCRYSLILSTYSEQRCIFMNIFILMASSSINTCC